MHSGWERNQIYNEDCLTGLKRLPDESVDLVITDPPFAIDFTPLRDNYKRHPHLVLGGYQEVKTVDYPDFTRNWMTQIRRVLKESGAAFIFSGWNNLKDILVTADALNLITVNHLIWKYQFGVVCKYRFVTSHYHCLYLCKDNKQRKFFHNARFSSDDRTATGRSKRYADLEDVWTIQREYWHGDMKTPTKLPGELIRKILAYTSEPGDLVLDPFLGSRQVAVISRESGRDYIGFEIVPAYFEFAKNRLAEMP
ncbi:MAG TPA: site-specific DNA-methyltransferase [Candidatus Hydrogenedentes bacterium]|jgi:site-specific DNA-methyltransferase (adenine-specific)|nr:MAG: DNA adenine methyltransferase YhdJ [Candidatus Hydrogenedentes bacterium ADurb.Bin170]HOD95471.1 site-specific DNA-methyltransferase [Candidatus Hydrogenedentota bacterium]HOM47600.1 site-specific DNA-methyltransferase [Candidatus Hydrogenedentota bacterium]HOR50704.1 site-specific DNA-methyltransferase [Candidatus Hydrogenedentota bacterium]HPK24109.1 site-specific DNA-methyltransferase [Candidatus Hydrogenedentota bacterium]